MFSTTILFIPPLHAKLSIYVWVMWNSDLLLQVQFAVGWWSEKQKKKKLTWKFCLWQDAQFFVLHVDNKPSQIMKIDGCESVQAKPMWRKNVSAFLSVNRGQMSIWMMQCPNGWRAAWIWTGRKCQNNGQLIIMKLWGRSRLFYVCFLLLVLFVCDELCFAVFMEWAALALINLEFCAAFGRDGGWQV